MTSSMTFKTNIKIKFEPLVNINMFSYRLDLALFNLY